MVERRRGGLGGPAPAGRVAVRCVCEPMCGERCVTVSVGTGRMWAQAPPQPRQPPLRARHRARA
eukprot:5707584-Prymnesium_polylepis.1